jgi:hypothetical protein
MNSDTPRTDNAALHGDGTTVPADFAADLEREINASKAEVERLREALEGGVEAIDWLTHHLSAHHGCLHMDPDVSGIPSWIANARAALKETK